MEVGLDLLGPLGARGSSVRSGKGDDERAEEEAARYVKVLVLAHQQSSRISKSAKNMRWRQS
jgi:hypothetical protein